MNVKVSEDKRYYQFYQEKRLWWHGFDETVQYDSDYKLYL